MIRNININTVKKFAVGYPWTSEFIFTKFCEHLPNLERPEGVDVRFFRGVGWCPARRHTHICEQAIDWGAELILIIGADQVHPPDLLPRLYKRFQEGYDIVAAFVPARGFVPKQPMRPFQPVAYRLKTNDETGSTKIRIYDNFERDGDMFKLLERKDGEMISCNICGSGVIMFHVDYLLSLKKPWFFETYDNITQERMASMDTKFAWRLQDEAGGRIYIDTTIMVEHLHIFNIDDSFQYRFLDWRQEEKEKKRPEERFQSIYGIRDIP